MEKKTLSNEQVAMLLKPLPQEAISQHPTKTFLSTIKAIYVTERLNEVFGVGAWKTKTEFVERVDKMVVTKTTLEIPEYGIYYEQFGGNDNQDLGDAYKGATTDAITKIGSYLGIAHEVFKGKQTHNSQADTKKPVSKYEHKDKVVAFYAANPECLKKLKATYGVSEPKYLKHEKAEEVYQQLVAAGKIA